MGFSFVLQEVVVPTANAITALQHRHRLQHQHPGKYWHLCKTYGANGWRSGGGVGVIIPIPIPPPPAGFPPPPVGVPNPKESCPADYTNTKCADCNAKSSWCTTGAQAGCPCKEDCPAGDKQPECSADSCKARDKTTKCSIVWHSLQLTCAKVSLTMSQGTPEGLRLQRQMRYGGEHAIVWRRFLQRRL